ncbi:sigma-70 family RNA polymerase sigma factor [Streptomyces sp. NPDC049585]|uniref:sigma-70 family RNA polymerase sigma factor n=1 Tax=Streptomyces sp. NPDC049585 TaxID=3155154 RepID=UPI003442D554
MGVDGREESRESGEADGPAVQPPGSPALPPAAADPVAGALDLWRGALGPAVPQQREGGRPGPGSGAGTGGSAGSGTSDGGTRSGEAREAAAGWTGDTGVREDTDAPPSDLELVAQLRGGENEDAYEELYRRHVEAVRRYARTCCRDEHTAEDLTNEVFASTLQAVRRGAGPDSAVRAYLLSSVRRVAATWGRTTKREHLVEDFAVFATSSAVSSIAADDDTLGLGADVRAMQEAERSLAVQAFRSLPERWQTVLWHTTVEEETPGEVAPLLGLSANATAVLAHRAREGLKQAYLQAHVSSSLTSGGECAQYADRLGAYARGRLRSRAERGMRKHLEMCARCRTAALEVADVNERLRALLPMAVIGWFAAGWSVKAAAGLAAGTAAGAGAAAAGGTGSGGAGGGGGAGAGAPSAGTSGASTASGASASSAPVTASASSSSASSGTSSASSAGSGGEGLGVVTKVGLLAGAVAAAGAVIAYALAAGSPAPSPRPQAEAPVPAPVSHAPRPRASQPRLTASAAPTAVPGLPAGSASASASTSASPSASPSPSLSPSPSVLPSPTAAGAAGPEASASASRSASPSPSRPRTPGASPAGSKSAPPRLPMAVYPLDQLEYAPLGDGGDPELRPAPGGWMWQRYGDLRIGGTAYRNGASVHAPSSVAVDLNRSCTSYDAFAGIDDMSMGRGAVTFSVFADGTRMWSSGLVEGGQPAKAVHVPLAGRRTLRLVVESRSPYEGAAVADWARGRITCTAPAESAGVSDGESP